MEQTENQEVDSKIVDETKAEVPQDEVNERLLKESKKYKSKYQEYKTKVDEYEQKMLEQQNDASEKAKYWEQKAKEFQSESNELKSNLLFGNLEKTLKDIAPDCQNHSLLLNNPKYEDDLKQAIDKESLTVDQEILRQVYIKDKESNPFLYGKVQTPKMASGSAKTSKTSGASTKSIDEMNPDELTKLITSKFGN